MCRNFEATYHTPLHCKILKKNCWKKKNWCTWISGVLLIEAIDGAKHEVEDHLAVWIVHAWGWGHRGALIIRWTCFTFVIIENSCHVGKKQETIIRLQVKWENRSPNLLISSLFTESMLYSSAKDLQRTTRRKYEFLPAQKKRFRLCGLLTLI